MMMRGAHSARARPPWQSKLTIAIPTHNRAALVRDTLASVAALAIPADVTADCLVIDNASTDDTAAVVDDFARGVDAADAAACSSRGSVRASREIVRLTKARRTIIFFIDDDAIAERDWAAELLDEMRRRDLDAACGMVLPRWSSPPPKWLGPSLWVKLAVHDRRAIESAPASSAERLDNYFSANVGFKRSAFARFGKFREDLGVVGGNPISGEDTELFARILARGGAMGFAPRAIVHHLIPPERMTLAYLRRKSFAFGMGTAFAGLQNHNRLDKLVRNGVQDGRGRDARRSGARDLSRTRMRELSRLLARPPDREIAATSRLSLHVTQHPALQNRREIWNQLEAREFVRRDPSVLDVLVGLQLARSERPSAGTSRTPADRAPAPCCAIRAGDRSRRRARSLP